MWPWLYKIFFVLLGMWLGKKHEASKYECNMAVVYYMCIKMQTYNIKTPQA